MTAIATAPRKRPVVGHAVPFARNRLKFLQEVRQHGPLVRVHLGPRRATVVNSPELIREMLTSKSGDFSKGLLFEKLKLFGKDALPVAENQGHLKRRRALQPAFHRQMIEGYVETMRQVTEPVIAGWAPHQTLDAKTEMQLMTQNAVMACCLSDRPGTDEAMRVLTSVDTVFTTAIQRAALPFLERLPSRRNRKTAAAQATLRETVARIIDEHRADPDPPEDVVTLLLALTDDDGDPLPDDDILAEIVGLLAAGSETTAVVLAWLFHELSQRPDLERRLHEEVDTVLGSERLEAAHVPRLPFTGRLVRETLRLYSPAWLVTRQATTDTQLGEYEVPGGEDIIWSPYAVHRDASLYPDPLFFDPDRWLPDRPQPPKAAFIPFGLGKRSCVGDAFALTEATVITALIASRWRLRPENRAAVRQVGAITLHPSQMRLRPEPRVASS